MDPLNLTVLQGKFTIHRAQPESEIPAELLKAPFLSITRTDEELSLVLPEDYPFQSGKSEPGWRCIKVCGPLDFSLTGILASLSRSLAEAGVSIFALSTFDTDYLLVKEQGLETAIQALEESGHNINRD